MRQRALPAFGCNKLPNPPSVLLSVSVHRDIGDRQLYDELGLLAPSGLQVGDSDHVKPFTKLKKWAQGVANGSGHHKHVGKWTKRYANGVIRGWLRRDYLSAAEYPALAEIWDNEEDDVFDDL